MRMDFHVLYNYMVSSIDLMLIYFQSTQFDFSVELTDR